MLGRIKIKPSFWFLAFSMFVLGLYEQFFIIFMFVSLHEIGHIFFGKIFSVETEMVIITPIGESAVMKNVGNVSFWKRFIIFISGPAVNIFFVIFFNFFNDEFLLFVRNVNFLLAFFNLLPIYPFDGGRIVMLFLNKVFPIITANKIVIKISSVVSCVLMVMGIIQIVLFPYNISLFCIGLYLFKTRRKTYFGMTFDFYKRILRNKVVLNDMVPLRYFCLDRNLEIKKILKRLYFDCYCVFYIRSEDGKGERKIFEWEIVEYIQKNGIGGKISDIPQKINFDIEKH